MENAKHNPAEAFRERWKWRLLFISAISKFSTMYNMGSLSTLQLQFQQQMGMSEIQYTRISQFEAIPGLILPMLIGALADYAGATLPVAIGILLGLTGQFLVTLGVINLSYWTLLSGLVLLHCSTEASGLGKNKIVRLWYKDNEISRANSVLVFTTILSSFCCNIFYPNLYQIFDSLTVPYLVGAGVCIVSSTAGVVQLIIHNRLLKLQEATSGAHEESHKHISFRSVTKLHKTFWLVIVASILGMQGIGSTKKYESKYLQTNFHFKVGEAGEILSVGLVASGTIAPIAAVYMDRHGRIPFFFMGAFVAGLLGIVGNILVSPCDRCLLPVIPLLVMSLGSGVQQLSSITSIMRISEKKNVGISLAMYQTTMSVFQLIIPWIVGTIAQNTVNEYGYHWVFVFNACIVTVAICLVMILQIIDYRGPQNLQFKIKSRHVSFAVEEASPLTDQPESTTSIEESLLRSDSERLSTVVNRQLLANLPSPQRPAEESPGWKE